MNVLIRDLDEKIVAALKKRASDSNRSLQAELKTILEEAASDDWQRTWVAADRIFEELRQSGQKFSDTTALLREDRERGLDRAAHDLVDEIRAGERHR